MGSIYLGTGTLTPLHPGAYALGPGAFYPIAKFKDGPAPCRYCGGTEREARRPSRCASCAGEVAP